MSVLGYGVHVIAGGTTSGTYTTISNVQQLSHNKGRDWATDPYSPPTCSITFRGTSTSLKVGNWILLTNDQTTVSKPLGQLVFTGTIKDIQVEYGIITNLDYTTILVEGVLARWGRRQLNSRAIAQAQTMNQISTLASAIGFSSFTTASGGLSIASAQTYTGNALDLINQIVSTEMGHINEQGNYSIAGANMTLTPMIYFVRRNDYTDLPVATFADDSTASGMRYENIGFTSAAQNYYTEATIQPLGLASQTAGSGFYNITQDSLDYTTGQALSHAQYLVSQYNTTNSTLYSVTASYQRQDTALRQDAFDTFIEPYKSYSGALVKVIFRGTSYLAIIEGVEITADTSDTTVTVTLSPFDNNNYLILNNAVFGTLGTSGTYPGNKLGF